MSNINRQLALMMLAASNISFSALAEEETSISEQDWGIAAVYRMASIPFYTANNDQTVGTFVPMMYFQNEHVFVEGLQGGAYLYKPEDEAIQLSALMRLRFVDIPSSEQNSNGGDAVDFGGQLRYFFDENWYFDAELMADDEFRFHSNLRISGELEYGDWALKPHVRLRYKEADFNSQYYTFSDITGEKVGGGVDLNLGIDARYHVYSNLYLLGATSVTRLDSNTYHSRTVEERYQGEFYIGFGFFNDQSKAPKSELKNKRYFRIAHGWATPSNIGEIINLNTQKDPYNNQMTSFFYGHPLTDELFGVPLDIYFTPGIVHHWSSEVQSASTEYVAAIKAYYTFDWPTLWRFGFAEGMSFIDSITYIEQTEMDSKGYNASNLLNYLDFSFDVNVGDLINNHALNNMWIGYSLHHRSAIFEQASQYGRIKGGSNYNSLYVQFAF